MARQSRFHGISGVGTVGETADLVDDDLVFREMLAEGLDELAHELISEYL